MNADGSSYAVGCGASDDGHGASFNNCRGAGPPAGTTQSQWTDLAPSIVCYDIDVGGGEVVSRYEG